MLFFGIVIVVERRPSFQINQSKEAYCMVRIVLFFKPRSFVVEVSTIFSAKNNVFELILKSWFKLF